MNTNNRYSLPQSFRNYREQNYSLESSPEGSPQDAQKVSNEETNYLQLPKITSITYIIYCHGEIVGNGETIPHQYFQIPFFDDNGNNRPITIRYLADPTFIMLDELPNIDIICDHDDDARETRRSGEVVNQMHISGGKRVTPTRPLGIYSCDSGKNMKLLFDMTPFGQPYNDSKFYLSEIMDRIFEYHRNNYQDIGFKITVYTCRVLEGLVFHPMENIQTYTVDKNLVNDIDKNINIGNAMDIVEDNRGGRKKSKTVKRKTKKQKRKNRKNRKNRKSRNR